SQAHRRYTQPDLRVQRLATQALFHDHPYALDPEGTEESLFSLTPADVRTYARERLVTSRLLLVVVGNVSRARVEALVAGSLGKLPRGDYRWTLPLAPVPPAGTRWLIDNRPLATTYMVGYFARSEEHTSELQSLAYLVCRLLLEKKNKQEQRQHYKYRLQLRENEVKHTAYSAF